MNVSQTVAAFQSTDIKNYLMDLGKTAKQKKAEEFHMTDKEKMTQIKLHLSNDRVNMNENESKGLCCLACQLLT